jgi:hypothetical protein
MRFQNTAAALLALSIATQALPAAAASLLDNTGGSDSFWQGFYVGATGGYYATRYTDLDAVAGVNFLPSEKILLGLEGGLGPYFDVGGGFGGGWEVYAAGRIGFLADRTLIYGVGGAEAYSWGGSHLLLGGGVEFAPWNAVSVRLQAVAHSSGDVHLSTGALLHF